jgi:hypothetical protein
LEVSCGGICVHIELGKERDEVVVGGVAVLVSFNVLEGGAKLRLCKECWISLRTSQSGARVADGDVLLSSVGRESKGVQCESEMLQAIVCAPYVSVLFYCVLQSSSFVSLSSFCQLGLDPHGQITYCKPGRQTK